MIYAILLFVFSLIGFVFGIWSLKQCLKKDSKREEGITSIALVFSGIITGLSVVGFLGTYLLLLKFNIL